MKLAPERIEALVLGILAVAGYRLDKVWAVLPALRDARLTDPAHVVATDIAALTVALAEAGYNRGLLTGNLASRLQELMKAVEAGALDDLEVAFAARDKTRALNLLVMMPGIGKRTAETVWSICLS
ncbi:MAG: hypothetical protein ACT4TC_00135 [Myxococcaceae bacterium]